jgi:hypothetical protein
VIATAIKNAGAGYLLAVKANQPTLRAEVEGFFENTRCDAADVDLDKSHGRIEQRAVTVALRGRLARGRAPFSRRIAPARRLTIIKVQSRAELSGRRRFETRYSNSSAPLTADKRQRPYTIIGSKTGCMGCWTRSFASLGQKGKT